MRTVISYKSNDIGDKKIVKEYNLEKATELSPIETLWRFLVFRYQINRNPKVKKKRFGNVNSYTGKPRK